MEIGIEFIFIIDAKNNLLIFLGQIDNTAQLNREDLPKILGKIISSVKEAEINTINNFELTQGKFLFGKYEKFYVIFKIKNEDPSLNDFMELLKETFIEKYQNVLNEYQNEDISKFTPLMNDIQELLLREKPKIGQKTTVEVPSTQEIEVEKIEPMVREAYPDGIPEYKLDEVLWNEAQLVMGEYSAEFVEGMISHLKLYLSLSIQHHFEIYVNFEKYPKEPQILVSEGLKSELGKPIEEMLTVYKNWDTKIPPHIIEIVREIEKILIALKTKGSLSPTSEIPEAALPELEPLAPLPLEEKIDVQELKRSLLGDEPLTIELPEKEEKELEQEEETEETKE